MKTGNPFEEAFDQLKTEALAHSNSGRYVDAIQTQIKIVNGKKAAGIVSDPNDHLRLGGYLFLIQNFSGAVATLTNAHKLFPENMSILENLSVNLMKLARYDEAAKILHKVVEAKPNSGNVLDGLAHCHGALGQMQESKIYGERAMLAKDAELLDSKHVLPKSLPRPFRHDQPKRNIISFSLFGSKQRYLSGAVRNATLQPDIYPGWTCRFYCDQNVPQNCLNDLRGSGAEIRMMKSINPFDGLFWRFAVANDPAVDRFLIRDCDAVINIRERVAVDDWLSSNANFHIMRDFYSHTELMLAGLWGGVGNILPPISELTDEFTISKLVTNAIDQWFLRQMVWPIVRQSCLIHDSHYEVFGSCDFPIVGKLPPGKHVGQNEHALASKKFKPTVSRPSKLAKKRVFKVKSTSGPDDIISGS